MNTKDISGTKITINRQIFYFLIILIISFIFFELTEIDIFVQDQFYNFSSRKWLIDRADPVLRFIFYTGLKGILIALGISIFITYLISFRNKKLLIFRKPLLIVSLSMLTVPLSISLLKEVTNVYCPSQIIRYGGKKPYIKVFERYPAEFQQQERGKCFPAGHASGGFALMALYFAFKDKKKRMLGLFLGFILGWIMGLYQMMKGVHFLSHTAISMIISWIIILFIIRSYAGILRCLK